MPVAWTAWLGPCVDERALMGLRNLLHRLSVPIEELDEQRLRDFCAGRADAVPIGAVSPRTLVTVVGGKVVHESKP